MKKIISFLLSLILVCTTVLPMNVCASDESYAIQTDNLLNYMQTEYPIFLQKNSNYEYVRFVNNFNSSALSLYFLHMADKFAKTGVKPDEKKYKEVLLNIIETHDITNSGSIAEQKKMDNLKTYKDYAMDTAKMTGKAVSVIAGVDSATSQLEKDIAMALDGISVLIDSTENWINTVTNLETVVQNYSYYIEFLTMIEKKSSGD